MVKPVGRKVSLQPPSLARLLFYIMTPTEDLEAVLGDMDEEFYERAYLHPRENPRNWYWHQSIASIPYWFLSKKPGVSAALTMVVGIGSYSLIMCWEMWTSMIVSD